MLFAGAMGAPFRDHEQYRLPGGTMKSKVTGALAAGIALAIPATTAASARTSGGESVKGIIVTSWGGESDG